MAVQFLISCATPMQQFMVASAVDQMARLFMGLEQAACVLDYAPCLSVDLKRLDVCASTNGLADADERQP